MTFASQRCPGKTLEGFVNCVVAVAAGERVAFCTLDAEAARAGIRKAADRLGVRVAFEPGDERLYVEAAK